VERLKMKENYIIGIDEVGRGPIAGPLVVCGCALKIGTEVLHLFPGGKLRDSKKLSEKIRIRIVEDLQFFIKRRDIIFGIGEISAEEIDSRGLSQSIKDALACAVIKIHEQGVPKDSFIFLDGSLHVDEMYEQETIIKGDEKIQEIALASIIAKVYRDTFMKKVADAYPKYGFQNHVGYGTQAHYKAIKLYGATPLHRKSFLKKILE
jgi:ribonuclease HII